MGSKPLGAVQPQFILSTSLLNRSAVRPQAQTMAAPLFTLYHTDTARSTRALWCMHEMGLAARLQLITMPFPPRIFYREV